MLRRLVVSVAALALVASPALAQSTAPRVEVTPYAGYMIFGDFAKGPLGTSLSNAGGALVGAQLGIHLTPHIALVGNVAHAGGDVTFGLPFIDDLTIGSASAWLFDGALQIAMPMPGALTVTPFLQVGAGAMRHKVSIGVSTTATNFVGMGGVGADIGLTRNVGLRFLVRDYVGRFDAQEATGIDYSPDIAHNVGLSAGLRLAF
jgi:hypothetical protein